MRKNLKMKRRKLKIAKQVVDMDLYKKLPYYVAKNFLYIFNKK